MDNSTRDTKAHNTMLATISVGCIGLISVSIMLDWEFWVPPVVIFGLAAAWFIHIIQYGSYTARENYFFVFSVLVAFYHGVHYTSFFDVFVVISYLMVTFALTGRKEFQVLFLTEFFILMVIQVILSITTHNVEMDSLNIARVSFHSVALICEYRIIVEFIKRLNKDKGELLRMSAEREADKIETEDFLVNVSHELRTPVNVINGMSGIILKKEEREDIASIRDAGLRLSHQIEDIQDYSEIQRGNVVLENDKYMITSLLNDIVVDRRNVENESKVELIVELDPDIPNMMRGDAGKIDKIIRHLLSNGFKYTKAGCVFLKVTGIKRDYGINLIIEVTDTGIGMASSDLERISKGIYQIDRKRNRSTGGIGLGLPVVYGFVREMKGFVTIESEKGLGTTVRISIAQEIVDPEPCLPLDNNAHINALFHMSPNDKKSIKTREYYKRLATDIAAAYRIDLFFAPAKKEINKILDRNDITHIFMGEEEYLADPAYFEKITKEGIAVAVISDRGFKLKNDSRVTLLPKPLNSYSIIGALNREIREISSYGFGVEEKIAELDGLRSLVVDDEPMNLVVATGLFKEYKMLVDTASSGMEAIEKFATNEYDVIFMDHMMPEMDGVEAMKKIRDLAVNQGKGVKIIALTANAISGAREMFLSEGFDGFISKPINTRDFERTMTACFAGRSSRIKGGAL
ncbi:MAG: response regulator [Lachnospiraceae bacterium]|nr:response regulator [Lachnospiraceae bacterium]